MTQNPEEYHNRDADDEEAEYEYDWTPYDERMRHAEAHLEAFVLCVENGMNDLIIGQQAQNTLEHGMKALLEAHRVALPAHPQHRASAGTLVRHIDPELREFAISIAPDIYTQVRRRAGV